MKYSLLCSAVFVFQFFDLFQQTLSGVVQVDVNSANKALIYLSKFGYVDPRASNSESGALISIDVIKNAISAFQDFAGLNVTGVLDEETQELMNTPRCGVKDKIGYGSNARKKRYALQGSRWKVKHLTYKITKYPKYLKRTEVDIDIEKAFKVWSGITELTFSPAHSGKVHIEIRFEKDEHGDGDAFDGPGGTLAHAYFPIYGGDAHFDDSETWTVNTYKGTNLFQVAAHEFGHSLGLSHSDVRSALMAPFYRGYQRKFKLDKDDILAIQSLYGEKSPERRPVTTTTRRPYNPSKPVEPKPVDDDSVLCKNSKFDAVTTMMDNKTYVFKGSHFWQLTDDGIARGYPKRITREFMGLPSHIDAAFTWTNGKTYFFKGKNYYRFSDFELDANYPKTISQGFAGIPNNVDAAFVWSGNGKIYFFKHTNYYKFDPTKTPPVSAQYPKDISSWDGLPYYMDGAMQYSNGYTYFFKNGKYWRFNDRGFKVDTADPTFPRLTGRWWFGCSKAQIIEDEPLPAAVTESGNDYNDDTYYNHDYDHYYDNAADVPRLSGGYSAMPDSGNGVDVTSASSLAWIVLPLLLRIIFL